MPVKGIDLILEAIGRSKLLRECEMTIVGDGPHKPMLEKIVARSELDRVQFVGWLDQGRLAAQMRASQAFVFPSLREFGGGVVLEAMACGLPTIVADYGGPAELATSECGILLAMSPREQLIASLKCAMERLASDHNMCRQYGAAAGQRIRDQFTWEKKAARVVEFYTELLTTA